MKHVRSISGILAILAFCITGLNAQNPLSADEKKIIKDFELRAKRYADRRNQFQRQLPKLPKDATPEQIDGHKQALQKLILKARVNQKQGNMFTQSASQLIRSIIKREFKGYEAAEIRQAVLEADTKGVPIKVNAPYPESKELVEMTPPLLQALPQLPKELRFRYIGRSLVVMDRDNALILDYMKDALP